MLSKSFFFGGGGGNYLKLSLSCPFLKSGNQNKLSKNMIILYHCSPESNLVKNWLPEKPTTDFEKSSHGDFKNDKEIALTISAKSRLTEYALDTNPIIFLSTRYW